MRQPFCSSANCNELETASRSNSRHAQQIDTQPIVNAEPPSDAAHHELADYRKNSCRSADCKRSSCTSPADTKPTNPGPPHPGPLRQLPTHRFPAQRGPRTPSQRTRSRHITRPRAAVARVNSLSAAETGQKQGPAAEKMSLRAFFTQTEKSTYLLMVAMFKSKAPL